ncbi:MAG: O-acetylhomoserine aminocarboxypropyltransferase/cysteine synthase [Puniceicoccales bacterium]|jgi:O-acetylhomoserine (thiol)-lyase|nr:O-acetylhomoserine aminocarboxypropyltransferase/cysteine synthase [Puniceicoccales bacterium]
MSTTKTSHRNVRSRQSAKPAAGAPLANASALPAKHPPKAIRQAGGTVPQGNPPAGDGKSGSPPVFAPETLCIQAGYSPKVGEPRIPAIVQSTTYKYDDIDQVNRVMTLQEFGYKYTRTGNPTVTALEEKVLRLEGGAAAVATASGQAATLLSVANIVRAGDHILAASTLYGGTFTLFNATLKKFGVSATFFDPEAPAREIARLFRPETKLLFGETIGNPGLNILDFHKLAALARANGVPLVVDNTLATPLLCQPFKHGANIVIHSATKFLDGHAAAIGGVIIDGGNFDWAGGGRFPDFTEPDPTYNNVRYTGKFPKAPYLAKARAQLLRDFGGCLAPQNAFLINLGIETLHLRIPRHGENALALARFLAGHPRVAWVNHPLLSKTGRSRVATYFNQRNGGGVLTFGLKGDAGSIRRFVKRLRIAALVVHVGDLRTGILHPASSTHAQLTAEEQRACGITPDLIRVSVGLESIHDLVADFQQALE